MRQVPNLATLEGRVDKRRIISHYFRKVLQAYDVQVRPPRIPSSGLDEDFSAPRHF